MPFLSNLSQSLSLNNSILCVGLDTEPTNIPVSSVLDFNKSIIDYTYDLVCAYKLNLAFYEAMGISGLKTLHQTITHVRLVAPSVLIIGDAKRGDIDVSSQAYAQSMFQVFAFDAVTVNPYGGEDTILPFLEYSDRGIYIWCRGSNPGATDIQDLIVQSPFGNIPMYQYVALKALSWNKHNNVGLVVGATHPSHLSNIQSICSSLPLLIPGLGHQGGNLSDISLNKEHSIISVSRSVIYASHNSDDYARSARNACISFNTEFAKIVSPVQFD